MRIADLLFNKALKPHGKEENKQTTKLQNFLSKRRVMRIISENKENQI